MASTSETGHAKNVANLETLNSSILGFGGYYNPSKPSLKLSAMQILAGNAKNVVGVVNSSFPAESNARNAREVAFSPLSKTITRVMNILKSSDTSTQVDESARTFARKIQGTRASAKKTDEEKQALLAEGKVVKENSTSQMSYDTRLDSLDKLIKLLASIPQYAPNEADLKVTALTALYNDLKAKNTAVISAATIVDNARITRDDLMYKPLTGLVDIALDSKMYIKGVFGASSPQYKQISKLTFTRPR